MSAPGDAALPFILATAGHVDHGKSSLVRALTGTDPDRLPEEKARGITIDLGFAHLELDLEPAPELSAVNPPAIARFSCGLIDVPGHEDFVGNMVSGVGSIDLALLAVAADDGWMPQTEEHLQILLHLGVQHAVVALTKCDLSVDRGAALDALRRRLAGTPFAAATVIPTSVTSGEGLPELRRALARALSKVPPAADLGRPRLWIDRVFSLRGAGTVVTGTLTGGSLSAGDVVVLQPGGAQARIRACHTHGREVAVARPGTRTALNLPELGIDASGPRNRNARRGNVVTRPGLGGPSRTLDVLVERFNREAPGARASSRPIEHGAAVLLQLGSARIPARLIWLDVPRLGPGERGVAQLRLESPILAFAGDRFVLRDETCRWTLVAGGVVLDPGAPRPRARAPKRVELLRLGLDPAALLRLQVARAGCLPADELLVRSRWPTAVIATALASCLADRDVVLAGPWVVDAAALVTWRELAATRIREHHLAHPGRPGLPLSELRSLLRTAPTLDAAFDELVALLQPSGFVVDRGVIRDDGHRARSDRASDDQVVRLRAQLDAAGLEAPGAATLAPDPESRRALRHLIQTGGAIELGPDAVIAARAFRQAREAILDHLRQRGSASASELRQQLGTSRRILIPLLERLDREGYTRRDGDQRRLGPRATGSPGSS